MKKITLNLSHKEINTLQRVLGKKLAQSKKSPKGKGSYSAAMNILANLTRQVKGWPSKLASHVPMIQNNGRSKRSTVAHGGSKRVNSSGSSSGSSSGNSSGDPDPEPARPRSKSRLLATRLDAFKEVLA